MSSQLKNPYSIQCYHMNAIDFVEEKLIIDIISHFSNKDFSI